MNKKSISRVDKEANEKLETIENQVPENKLQTTQQVAETQDALKTEAPESSFAAKKSKVKGATLKQEAIADVITGSSSASGMGINAAGRGVSGTNGGVLGANNSTPVANKSRSDSRVGKKLDRLATKLNFTPSEQVIVDFDESKPLADANDTDQGYNGTYRNEYARSQKIMGAVPADLMFQRSADYIIKDKLYFVEGQQVFQTPGERTDLNPKTSTFNETEVGGKHDVQYHSGNYLHRDLRFGLDDNGQVDFFMSDVEDLTNTATPAELVNVSSAHKLIKQNTAEIDRQVMDSKAGDEKADIWTPLARAIDEPTANAYIMSSIEADTGAYVHLAYSKGTTNYSFQLNRAAKDGITEVKPAIEQCIGWRSTAGDSFTCTGGYDALDDVFNSEDYSLGDPALMIAAYDSINKYKNKADLLLQPRGWRMHFQTADNNMNPLKVPTEYAKVYAGQEVYSTIDHEYDPILPICMTDRANLITVHNFNELAGFATLYKLEMTFSWTNIEEDYKYVNINLLPKGVCKNLGYDHLYIHYKKDTIDGFVYSYGDISVDPDSNNVSNKKQEIIVSTESSVDGYTLLATVNPDDDFDVIFRMPIVQNANDTVITKADLTKTAVGKIYYNNAGPYSYSYFDLRNQYFVDVKHPLIEGIIQYLNNAVGGKFRSLLRVKDTNNVYVDKELFIPLVFSTQYMTLAPLIICAATPFISRVRINSMKDVIYYEDNVGSYPYSKLDSIKNVPFHNYVNFTFTGYDEPLGTKVMNPATAIQWVMPEFIWKVGSSKYVLPWYFNENECQASDEKINYDASAMSFPSIRSGIRLGALDTFYGMSEKDVRLSLDRLTKELIQMRSNDISAIKAYKYGRNTDGQPYVEFSDNKFFTMADYLKCSRELGLCMDAPAHLFEYTGRNGYALTHEVAPSFNIKVYVNNNTLKTPDILNSQGVNISRAANYTQKWFRLYADEADSDTVIAGLVFGMNDEGAAEFKPWATFGTGTQYTSGPAIVSLQRSLWTRLQLLPFVISPFDGHPTNGSSVRDIYDIAYMFGLAGFRASDYRESVYNREKEVVNQGYLFISDPWVQESPIIKEGASSTGLSVIKGYEVKRS